MRAFFIILAVSASPALADWSIPLPSGEPHEIVVADGRAFVANGSGGIMKLAVQDGALVVERNASTIGDALRVFVEGHTVYVFTSLSNLHLFSSRDLSPIGIIRLGAWDVAALNLLKGKLYYVRKLFQRRRDRRGNEYGVNLYYAGRASLSAQRAVPEQEFELGAMTAYDIVPVRGGELAAVSLGTSGVTLINFNERPARAIDYVVNIGDVRKLGLAQDRFLLAADAKAVMAINLETYFATADETEVAKDETEVELPELDIGDRKEARLIKIAIGQRAETFAFVDQKVICGGASGVSLIDVPEIGTDLSAGGGWGKTSFASIATLNGSLLWSDGEDQIGRSNIRGKQLSVIRTDRTARAMALCGQKLLVSIGDELWLVGGDSSPEITKANFGSVDHLLGFEGHALALKGSELLALTVADAITLARTVKLRGRPQALASDGTRIVYAEGPRDPNDGLDRLWEVKDDGESLLRELEGRITALAVEGSRVAVAASDTIETGKRRPPTRHTLEILDGKSVVAKGAQGPMKQLVLSGEKLLGFDGGYLHLIEIADQGLTSAWRMLASDLSKFELRDDLLICCGSRGFRSYELRKTGPYYVARSREPEARMFAVAGEDFFGFFGNRIERKQTPPLRLPESGFTLAEGGMKNGAARLAAEDVARQYGQSYTVLDGGIDVCSADYEALRGYRLRPVHQDLSGADWQSLEVEPDTVAVDPKAGRVKFSDGSPTLMERIGQVAGIMYSAGRFQVTDDRICVALGENANPFIIYDISDYAFPKELGLCPGGVRFPHDVAMDEQLEYAYLPVSCGALEVTRIGGLSGSGHEMIKKPATTVANWTLPGAGKTFKLQFTSGGRRPAERINSWRPPAGGSPTSAEVVGDLCYVGNRGGYFFVLDIKDRENPKFLGQCVGGGWVAAVKDGYAYTSSGGLTIIDVRDPSKPKPVGRVSDHQGEQLVLLGPPHEGLLAMGSRFEYGAKNFYLVSVKDPTQPKILGTYPDKTIACSSGAGILPGGKQAILVDAGSFGRDYSVCYGNHAKLILLDISDPANIKKLNVFRSPDEGDYRGMQIDYEKMVAYINDRSFGVWFYDIKDPAKPQLLGGVPASGEADYSYFWNNHLYFDTTAGGAVWSVDFSDPESPKKVGYYWDGVWTARTDLCGKDGVIYAPLLRYGLKVIDGRDPSDLRLAKEIRVNVASWAYDADGDWLYVVAVEGGKLLVKVYEIADPLDPTLHSEFPLQGMAGPVKLDAVGRKLYVASLTSGREGVSVYEFPKGERKTATLSGSLPLAGALKKEGGWQDWKLQVVGGKAFIFGDMLVPQLTILDVRHPKAMGIAFANPLDTRGRSMNFTVAGDYVYANWYYPGVQVYDTSDPLRPMRLAGEPSGPGGEFSKDAWSSGHVRGRYMYCPKLSFAVSFTVPRSTQAPTGKVELRQ